MASNIKPFKWITTFSTYSSSLCGTTRSLNLPRSDSTKSKDNANNNIVIGCDENANKWNPNLFVWNTKKLRNAIPNQFWRRTTSFTASYSFTLKENVANAIAKAVTRSIKREGVNRTMIEVNPGLGLLTKALLDNRLKRIVVYDNLKLAAMTDLENKYRGRITVKPYNFFLSFQKKEVKGWGGFTKEIMKYKDQKLAIVGINPNRIFMRRILQTTLWNEENTCDNIVFYLVMCQNICNCFLSSKGTRSRMYDYGLFHILMEMECLQKFRRESFLPPPKVRFEAEDMVLVRVSRKRDTPVRREDWYLFHNIVHVLGRSHRSSVLGTLEKWFPGSGPYFIARGLSASALVGSLSPEELVNLFYMIKDLKGYDQIVSFLGKATALNSDLDDMEAE